MWLSKSDAVPDMTYNVFGGTLNLAQSQSLDAVKSVWQAFENYVTV